MRDPLPEKNVPEASPTSSFLFIHVIFKVQTKCMVSGQTNAIVAWTSFGKGVGTPPTASYCSFSPSLARILEYLVNVRILAGKSAMSSSVKLLCNQSVSFNQELPWSGSR